MGVRGGIPSLCGGVFQMQAVVTKPHKEHTGHDFIGCLLIACYRETHRGQYCSATISSGSLNFQSKIMIRLEGECQLFKKNPPCHN